MTPGSAVEMTGAWKTRKTKPRFPFVFPSPWKSLRDSHIPTAPAMAISTHRKQTQKTRKEPAQRPPELYSFRLILGLENAPRSACATNAACAMIDCAKENSGRDTRPVCLYSFPW
jgi:hypothetical protein